jgi:hypothetical protein
MGFDWAWVQAQSRWFLPVWFVVTNLQTVAFVIINPSWFGFDARLYQLAAYTWLNGANPWEPALTLEHLAQPFSYAGPPITLLPFLLLDWVPPDVLILLLALASTATILWVIHRLGLPIWWMLFPPILEGLWVGNLNILVLGLLVLGGTATGALAIVLKVYAALPQLILGQWRPVVIAAAAVVVTAPFLPWRLFLEQQAAIAQALAEQAWGGETNVLTSPIATVGAAIALVSLGRERAAWLAVPVLWPATQLHYTVLAIPVLASTPGLAAAAAVNEPGVLGLGVICYAFWLRRSMIVAVVNRRSRGIVSRSF